VHPCFFLFLFFKHDSSVLKISEDERDWVKSGDAREVR
jgi:hypothetical protein